MRSTREWFISRAGDVQGPISTATIRDRLAQGELTPLDQICQAGSASDLQWKLIFECVEFTPVASTPSSTTASANSAAEWVLLRQTTTGQFSLKRSGPYTTDDIALMLRESSIDFSDYVWKKGFQRWAQLQTLREFNHSLPVEPPKLEIVRATPPPMIAPYNEMSEDVASPPPVSAANELTQEEVNAFRQFHSQIRAATAPVVVLPEPSSVWARVTVAAFLSIGVMLGLAALKPWKKHTSQRVARGLTMNDDDDSRTIASSLRILPLDMETHPKLEFDMSTGAKSFVHVRITGRDGQILHKMRFDQTVTLQKKSTEAPVLDLTPLGLPDGTYEVSATDGQNQAQEKIFVGAHNAQFERELTAHRQEIAREQLVERRAVYDMAGRMATLVDQLPAKGSVAAGAWATHYAKWMNEFQTLMRSSSLDQAAAQSAEPALLQAAQGVAKTVHDQAAAMDMAVNSGSNAQIPATALKNQLRRLQVQASGSKK